MSVSTLNEDRRPRLRDGIAWRFGAIAVLCALPITPAWTQTPPDLRQILERLDRLEAQNQALTAEVHALREELAARGNPPAPPVEERLAVQETRTAELAESKTEAAHRLPLRITGMALVNTYFNTGGGGAQYASTAAPGQAPSGGATFRQSIIGLDYSGPRTFGDGKISGSLRLDLFGGTAANEYVRLRTASLSADWKTRSFMVGVDKPLISPREPDSLAQVGISPLSGAGNLWYWIPQARFTQEFQLGAASGLRAQIAAVQTHEIDAAAAGPYGAASPASAYYEPARPGVEARIEFFHGTLRRIEIAPGFHHSVSHVEDSSVPSDVYSVDWLLRPARLLEFTGEAFAGRNVAPLGTGGLHQGIVIRQYGPAAPVHSRGGWGQLTLHAAPRLWFNIFTGQQDDRNSDLPAGGIAKNLAYGSNVFFRLAPNVLASFEASQTRTSYIGALTLRSNHYDLAFAYLF
jgi:uncharacterized protein (UPF0335 family)